MRDPSYKPPGYRIVTVPLEPALHVRLRVFAFHQEVSVKTLVTKAIREYLENHNA